MKHGTSLSFKLLFLKKIPCNEKKKDKWQDDPKNSYEHIYHKRLTSGILSNSENAINGKYLY